MNRELWLRRVAAVVTVLCAFLAIGAAVRATGDVGAVIQARGGNSAVPVVSGDADWQPPRPAVKAAQGQHAAAINSHMNARLSALGLVPTNVSVGDLQPLGGGLSLAEVRIEAQGDAKAALAAAQWTAVNREAVRLKSLALSQDPTGGGQIVMVLLVVVA